MTWRLKVSSWSTAQKGAAIALGLALLAAAVSFSDWRRGKVRGDLVRRSLAASRVLYGGRDPYTADKAEVTNFRYFPLNAVVLGPLAPLPDPVAQGVWYALNTGLMLWCFWRHRHWVRELRVPWWVWAGALAISGRFILNSLTLGQWNTSVYCLAFIGLSFLEEKRRWTGAALLGLSAVLKYMPSFFILYLLAKRRWRDAGAVALAIAVWFLVVPSLVLGPIRHIRLLESYRSNITRNVRIMRSDEHAVGFSLSASLYLLLTPATRKDLDDAIERRVNIVSLPPKVASRIADAVVLAVLLGGLALVLWRGRRDDNLPQVENLREVEVRALAEVGFWFALLLLISPEVRKAQMLSLFTPCFAVLLAIAGAGLQGWRHRTAAALLLLALVLVLASSSVGKGATFTAILVLYGSWTLVVLAIAAAAVIVLTQRRQGEPG